MGLDYSNVPWTGRIHADIPVECVMMVVGAPQPHKYKCVECGSTDLEFRMWVNQDMEITTDCEDYPYCNECEEETRCE